MDIWSPDAPRLDLVALGDCVTALNLGITVETAVALFVLVGRAVGVRGWEIGGDSEDGCVRGVSAGEGATAVAELTGIESGRHC